MMPPEGLKGLLVVVDPLDAAGSPVTAPIIIIWTSGENAKSEEISAGTVGGFLALCSPSPTNGITALSIVATSSAVVHVACLG